MSGTDAGSKLNILLVEAWLEPLDATSTKQFEDYLSLYLRWNARMNLSAIRNEEQAMSRHLIESIYVARALPHGIATLLDFGSGAGLPGIPIALCRPEIEVTLAESQRKKAAFLQEAVRTLGISARVYAGRAESLNKAFDCVVLRAVDKMQKAAGAAVRLVAPGGWLALMTTRSQVTALAGGLEREFSWKPWMELPSSAERIVAIGSSAR
jgi:16S rRNA (guanine527-N7)-methyltransferase